MKDNERFYDLLDHPQFWDESIKIYNDSFPEWEKESTSHIYQNIESQRYKMISYVVDAQVQGFYILDINLSLEYVFFTFLAVKEELRSQGIGTKLCKNAIDYFQNMQEAHWLFIEAQERQSRFYGSLGFKKLVLEYLVPSFNSDQSIPMHLMCIQKVRKLQADQLTKTIENIFIFGYSLDENDPRVQEQLDKIPNKIDLIDW